jgi:hypothetical protein
VVGIVSEELKDEADPTSVFYAGVGATEIAVAVSELTDSVEVPIEDYQSGRQPAIGDPAASGC